MRIIQLLETEEDPFRDIPATPDQLSRDILAFLHMYRKHTTTLKNKSATMESNKLTKLITEIEQLRKTIVSTPGMSLPKNAIVALDDFVRSEKQAVSKSAFDLGMNNKSSPMTGSVEGRFLNHTQFTELDYNEKRTYFEVFNSTMCQWFARYADKDMPKVRAMSHLMLQLTELDQLSNRIYTKNNR